MNLKKYTVIVQETLCRAIEVEAESENAAEQKVRDMYDREEIVLTADDYYDTVFETQSQEPG